jgi:hypothetical protein
MSVEFYVTLCLITLFSIFWLENLMGNEKSEHLVVYKIVILGRILEKQGGSCGLDVCGQNMHQ